MSGQICRSIRPTIMEIKKHRLVRFFVRFFPALLSFCAWRATRVGQTIFILFGACKSNPILPHAPQQPKTVMQSVMQCGIICGK